MKRMNPGKTLMKQLRDWRGDGSFGPFSQKSFWENVKNPDESFGTD
jgi:hypothetical protein